MSSPSGVTEAPPLKNLETLHTSYEEAVLALFLVTHILKPQTVLFHTHYLFDFLLRKNNLLL
jgi:hypothetical protein